MITLSIITITYNAARLLPKTLDSVLRQTYPAVEHIIVDGASTDETMDIVGRYISDNGQSGGKHSVVAMSERDHGIYDAMNKGLDMSRGDYVCFLNAGDFLPDEHTLENIAECALSSGQLPAVVYGDTDIVDNDYRFLRHRRLSPHRNSRGARSATVCWCAIRRSMPLERLPAPRPTTPVTASLPTWTGAYA